MASLLCQGSGTPPQKAVVLVFPQARSLPGNSFGPIRFTLKKKAPRDGCLLTDVPLAGRTPSWQSPTRPRPRPLPTQDTLGRRPAPVEAAGQPGAQLTRTRARGDRVPPAGAQPGGMSPGLPRSCKRFKKSFQHSLTQQHNFLIKLSEESKPRYSHASPFYQAQKGQTKQPVCHTCSPTEVTCFVFLILTRACVFIDFFLYCGCFFWPFII